MAGGVRSGFKVAPAAHYKNELSDYISRNNFDALVGESSEALAREAFQRMDVQLDLSMRTAGILEG